MPNYEEFKNTIVSKIKNYLPADYADATVSINSVLKNNSTKLDGLTIRREGESICPNIYLAQFYEDYIDGRTLEDILSDIAKIRQKNSGPVDFDITAITDFDSVKDKISIKLINSEQNAEYLKGKPHSEFADLSAIYYIDLGTDECGSMTTVISDYLLSQYGVSVEELHQTAIRNMASNARFCTMFEVLSEIMSNNVPADAFCAADDMMFVLSNKNKINGASMLLCPSVMDMIADKVGKDYYLLPSSIHETLIVPGRPDMEVDSLVSMVREVNATQVAKEEQLSDHVYRYDYDNHNLVIAA